MDRTGSALVASVYRASAFVSVSAAKQNRLFIVSLSGLMCPSVGITMFISVGSIFPTTGFSSFFSRSRCYLVVLLMPVRGCFSCPVGVSGDGARYFLTLFSGMHRKPVC